MQLSLLFIALTALAQDNVAIKRDRRTALSSLEFKKVGGENHTIINNQRFTVEYACFQASATCFDLVLQETFFRDATDGAEGANGLVTVRAWIKQNPEKIKWLIKTPGDVGETTDKFYKVTTFGCCGDWDTKKFFSLATGKQVFESADNELLKIQAPNVRNTRYIAYSYSNPGQPLGKLQYGTAESLRQTVHLIEAELGQPPTAILRIPGKVDAQNLTLWAHDGDATKKGISGVSIVLKFDAGEVVIPVENDLLVIERATLPKGFRLTK